ncbi:NAD(P)/FAD-dependent oxidoreductase [Phenylobacterium sp. Root700]|uniref:flavin-containing monooxygenase n=1 Tax=Phenylobacterium sp. Root700 TaxID=1736591 RepID=UPI001F3E4758|nr:NAD(P)/FAD-dependent oxidoreductase [Phenylobacterium sp. Root700]
MAERDKRLTVDRAAGYVSPEGALARYLEDPYVQGAARPAVVEEVDAALIGAGFGGLQTAVHLAKLGVDNFKIIDKAGDVGGVWYWNRYPGASCDIESYVYMPLLEEMGYVPTEKYTRGPEIFRYAQSIAERFDLYRRALLSTQVEELRWDETAGRWRIRTDRGDLISARFVCLGTGVLQSVRLPAIPGIESFEGHSFHTSRWDYAYTGGDPTGGLDGLGDKRVGIVGTGATAVQCIPHLGAAAKHLYVFQRTPAAVPVRDNRPTDRAWAESLAPGWHKHRIENFNNLICGVPQEDDLVADGWTEVLGRISVDLQGVNDASPDRQLADFAYMEKVRQRVDEVVRDPATAEALKPWFNIMCKRPCFHDQYLPVFNQPNVSLVDTNGLGIERIEGRTVWAGGQAYELDCLIYASGFDFQGGNLAQRNRFEVYGRGGRGLTDKWAGGMTTLFGYFNHGFPNLFNQTATQAGLTSNVTHGLGEAGKIFAQMVRYGLSNGVKAFDATTQAEIAWTDRLRAMAGARTRYDLECTPGYYNNEGKPAEFEGLNSFYPEGAAAFIRLMDDWVSDGRFEGLDLARAGVAVTA